MVVCGILHERLVNFHAYCTKYFNQWLDSHLHHHGNLSKYIQQIINYPIDTMMTFSFESVINKSMKWSSIDQHWKRNNPSPSCEGDYFNKYYCQQK